MCGESEKAGTHMMNGDHLAEKIADFEQKIAHLEERAESRSLRRTGGVEDALELAKIKLRRAKDAFKAQQFDRALLLYYGSCSYFACAASSLRDAEAVARELDALFEGLEPKTLSE
jgi:hypothetical protein